MNPQDLLDAIKVIIRGHAQNQPSIPPAFFTDIRPVVLNLLPMIQPAAANLDPITLTNLYDIAIREFKSVYFVDMDPSQSLTKKDSRNWLTEDRRNRLPKDYINRYLRYMQYLGRSQRVLNELERSSESILGKLGDPQAGPFYVRGLVVGSIQSGKTGNFNAVINRAIDAGYNLIIILSGIMEDLRSQTQLRLETEVIGEGINLQTGLSGPKGVGQIERFGVQGGSPVPQVFSITSYRSDFRKTLQDANFSLNNRNLLVCKKNSSVLQNLLIWLSDFLPENSSQHSIPLLIVDDEADNASLNNMGFKGREYASKINGHIRSLLGLFSRKTYLGYTATPFANVIQDRNPPAEGLWPVTYTRDGETVTKNFTQESYIFPDDFIELLDSPSNYIGAKQIFDTTVDPDVKKIPLVELIDDHYDCFPPKIVELDHQPPRAATREELEAAGLPMRGPRREDPFPQRLPDSLRDAMECFILAIAIRLKRRPSMVGSKLYNPHNTMLIHISRFTDWQNRTRQLIQTELDRLIQRMQELPGSPDSIYARLEHTWNRYYAVIVENIRTWLPDTYSDEFMQPITFNDIKPLLPGAVQGVEVKAINSLSREKLVYTTDQAGNGKKYIAVGGNRLSRGFTLEGLCINYFIRDTNYADTLLQMGRWFGYRPGYLDCCKLFTTMDAIEKFNAATRTIEELEVTFKRMHLQGKTPQDFILRVRTHPGVLEITRPTILRNTREVNWSYQDMLVQTTQFELTAARITAAWTALKKLFTVFPFRPYRDNYYLTDTDVAGLYRFLDSPNTFHNFREQLTHIREFIDLCIKKEKLRTWRIAIRAGGRGTEIAAADTGLPGPVRLTKRSGPTSESSTYYIDFLNRGIFTGSAKSSNILTTGRDMSLWLDEEQIRQAEQEFVREKIADLTGKENELSPEEVETRAKLATKPERIYRERMSEDTGLLTIYLMDLREVFNSDELKKVRDERGIDESIPLVGYAIGFPPIADDIGGVYVQGKYDIEEDDLTEDFDEEILNNVEEPI